MAVVMVTVTIEPLIMGTMMRRNSCRSDAPSRLGRLRHLRGHALDGRRQDDHGEAGLEPDEDDDEREGVDAAASGSRAPAPVRAPVQTAFSRPYWGWPAGRQAYTKRQMTEAPTSEIASGRKMKVLATDSCLTRSNRPR